MSLIRYSAIATKLRAMQGQLISIDEWKQMSELTSVSEAADFLRRFPSYRELFSGIDTQSLHRSDIEKLLLISKYRDYSKLYRFADMKQREFLKTYFRHYELTLIKRALRECVDHKSLDLDMDDIVPFFKRHSKIDIDALRASKDIPSLINALGSDEYASVLSELSMSPDVTLFDYELALDQLYFKHMWEDSHKFLSAQESADIKACFGTRIDMLNRQWVYRSKKYYHLDAKHIYALLIPYSYKLKPAAIKAMVQEEEPNPGAMQNDLLDRMYRQTARKHPYSASIINTYLYNKEEEIERIINVIESIRYGLSSQEIMQDILRLESRRGVS